MTSLKIKAVALKLFAHNGYDGTSLENIAKEVGIRKSTIYSHFGNKEDLFITIFKDILNLDIQSLENLINRISNYSTEKKLHSIFIYYCKVYNADSKKDEVLFIKRNLLFSPAFLKEKLQDKIEEYESSLNKMLTSVFEEGFINGSIKQRDIKDLLATFYCIIDGLFVEARYYSRKEYVSRFDSIWNVFWSAVGSNSTQKDS